jgi:hypothetical protein
LIRTAVIKLLLLLSLTNSAFANIGSVTEYKGSGVLEREADTLETTLDLPVETNDFVVTAKGVVGITFEDDTQVRVGEHSELLIDDFVYDPNSSSGSLGLKVAMGTVKYASGNIAHNNPDTVDIQTPSATIAVRGTAFSMTVDELGSSLVILLPNFDGSVGEIIVGSDAGQVILNKAFQATSVSGRDAKPKQPVILAIDESMINNLLIIAPPKRVVKELVEENKNNPLAINFLDYDELGEDLLASTDLAFDTLTINELITNLLGNMLANVFNSDIDGRIAGFNNETGVYTFIDDSRARVARYSANSYVDVFFTQESGVNMSLFQTDAEVYINTLDPGSDNILRINQQ